MRSGNRDTESAVFKALADGSRREILDFAKKMPGINVTDLCEKFPTSRFAVMKHLNILEEAGLIVRERDGNSRKIFLNPKPLKAVQLKCREWI